MPENFELPNSKSAESSIELSSLSFNFDFRNEIQNEVKSKIDDIKMAIAKKLGEFLPNWVSPKITINLTASKNGNWHVNKDNIINGDLGILTLEDYFDGIIKGTVHEIFHIWMEEKQNQDWRNDDLSNLSEHELRNMMIFRTIDEGLATLISGGPNFKEYHEEQGKNYDEYIQDCFIAFNSFLKAKTREELVFFFETSFQNSQFSIVGNEIAKIILEKNGIDNFKKIINEARKNPETMFKEYREICEKDNYLPKINPTEIDQ